MCVCVELYTYIAQYFLIWQEQVDELCEKNAGDVDDDVVRAQSKDWCAFACVLTCGWNWTCIKVFMLWSLHQVKKALRARGKQPDKNREDMGEANGETEATQPAVKQPEKGKGRGRGRGRGRKASVPVAPAEKEVPKSPVKGEAVAQSPVNGEEVAQSPVKGEVDKRKAGEAVQTPSKPSPNPKGAKKRVSNKAKATDGADGKDVNEQMQESWAEQDWNS